MISGDLSKAIAEKKGSKKSLPSVDNKQIMSYFVDLKFLVFKFRSPNSGKSHPNMAKYIVFSHSLGNEARRNS